MVIWSNLKPAGEGTVEPGVLGCGICQYAFISNVSQRAYCEWINAFVKEASWSAIRLASRPRVIGTDCFATKHFVLIKAFHGMHSGH